MGVKTNVTGAPRYRFRRGPLIDLATGKEVPRGWTDPMYSTPNTATKVAALNADGSLDELWSGQ